MNILPSPKKKKKKKLCHLHSELLIKRELKPCHDERNNSSERNLMFEIAWIIYFSKLHNLLDFLKYFTSSCFTIFEDSGYDSLG